MLTKTLSTRRYEQKKEEINNEIITDIKNTPLGTNTEEKTTTLIDIIQRNIDKFKIQPKKNKKKYKQPWTNNDTYKLIKKKTTQAT